jgi:hypothetical protein
MFIVLNIFYNIVILKKDITEKVRLVVLHGLATIDGTHVIMLEQGPKRHARYSSATTISAQTYTIVHVGPMMWPRDIAGLGIEYYRNIAGSTTLTKTRVAGKPDLPYRRYQRRNLGSC